MAKVALQGLGTDDDGNVFADSNSPLGQQVLQQMQYMQGPMGMQAPGGANLFQTAASAFQAITGYLDQDTANTLRKDLQTQQTEIARTRDALAPAIDGIADLKTREALRLVSDIDRRQNLALETEIELAKLQRRSSMNSGITGGINLAGQFAGGGFGGGFGGGGFGGPQMGGFGWAGPAALGGLAGYALGRNSTDDE